MSEQQQPPSEGHAKAYETMLARVVEAVERLAETSAPRVRAALSQARDRAVELGELTRDEAERISTYLERDIEAAGRYLDRESSDLAGWFRMDRQLLESWLLDAFSSLADRARLDLQQFNQSLQQAGHWRTGEITGPGVLRCQQCGEELHFQQTGHVPPCPVCQGVEFDRTPADGATDGREQ